MEEYNIKACPIHNKTYKMFCKKCKKFICHKCEDDHDDHDVKLLKNFFKKYAFPEQFEYNDILTEVEEVIKKTITDGKEYQDIGLWVGNKVKKTIEKNKIPIDSLLTDTKSVDSMLNANMEFALDDIGLFASNIRLKALDFPKKYQGKVNKFMMQNKKNIKMPSYNQDNISNEKVIAIGEIGLDYHYTKENKKNQKELFIKQINLANKYNKTIVIHSRDAMEDTYNILKEYKKQNIKCDMHCYSGSLEMAKRLIPLNIRFGIGGVLTFKNEKKLKEIVKELELKNFVLETDSPYLTPEPFRGHKNEPVNIKFVAKKISELKNIDIEEIFKTTTENAKDLFDLNI